MKSQKQRSLAEMLILLFGGLLLSVQGAKHVVGVLYAAPTLPATAYGAGELTGQVVRALCPLLIGIGLFMIAYRRRYMSRARVRGV